MLAKIITATLLLYFCNYSYAQNKSTNSSTTIFAYFKKGEKMLFDIEETSTQYAGLKVMMKASILYRSTMEILEDSANHYLIEWRITTSSTEHKKFPVYLLIAGMRDGLTVRYKTNKQGIPIEIIDLPQVLQTLRSSYDSLVLLHSFDPINQALANQFSTLLKTPGGILDVFLKPLFLYHAAYGGQFDLHKPTYRAENSLNAFGGSDFPTVVIVELSKLELAKDFAQLTIDQIVNKELAAMIIAGKLKEITEDATGKNVKDGELPEQIKMKDHNEFDVILQTGWLSRAYYERITKDGLSKKIDRMEIVLR